MKKIMTILVIILVDVLCADIDVGAHVAVAPAVIFGIASLIQQMAAQQQQAQAQRGSATAAAAGQGGAEKSGIQMEPAFQKMIDEAQSGAAAKTGQMPMQDPEAEAYLMENAMQAGGTQSPVASRIQQAQATADTTGKVPVDSPIMGGEGIEKLPEKSLLHTNTLDGTPKEGFFGDMSKADKLAMAAQLGSMLRGPGAPPPPSAGGGGVRGIDMQPAFTNVTLRQLYGGR